MSKRPNNFGLFRLFSRRNSTKKNTIIAGHIKDVE